MIGALRTLFSHTDRNDPEALQYQINVATAALLIETSRADFTEDACEVAATKRRLCRCLQLTGEQVDALLAQATNKADEAISLYEFTRIINDHCDAQEKLQLIASMWTVAYADGKLNKYEEHLIRQVAELIYISHADYIHQKLAAKRRISAAPKQ